MHLLAVGLNHETAPIEMREKVAFGSESIQGALSDLTGNAGIAEAAILSTCNRTEIYCGQENPDQKQVLNWLVDHNRLTRGEFDRCLYFHPNEAAVKHAFRVASGLDSMILGEPQILGQMKEAFEKASYAGTTGKILNRLFQHSFRVAKQVRTDTAIGENAVSVAYAGVNLAKRVFTSLAEQTVLLVGAGETIELVARHLRQNAVKAIIVANRSVDKARALAREMGSEAITLGQIPARLHQADIIVTSTASALPILGKGAIEAALKRRKHNPVFILDLAVPRDVEPEVRQLRDVYLYTVDDLKSVVDGNRAMRVQAAEQAENIIDLQVVKFMRWKRSLEAVPAIRTLRESLNELGQLELENALKRLERGADPAVVLEQFARDLTNKVAHQPSQVLRQAEIEGNTGLVSAARKLFGL
ncbi:MAG: glutamyl-tRNA reductase [Gammaproteobacteria bacterium]|nr:glutamyl-tRNA reductase [Gammaproteobacteria bacterium]